MARDGEDYRGDRKRHRRRRRHWRLGILLFFLLLGVGVWFLPAVIAHTPLRQQMVSLALPGLNGSASVGGASLGWLSPIELRDIELKDNTGATVLTAESVTTEVPLWRLAVSSANLGKVKIQYPDLRLILRPGGSNLEDVINPMLAQPSSGPPPAFALEVVDGRVSLAQLGKDQKTADASQPTSAIEKIQATVTHAPGADDPLTASLQCNVSTGEKGAKAAPLSTELKLKPAAAGGRFSADRGRLALKANDVDLRALTPLAVRALPPMTLSGGANADLVLDWDANTSNISLLGTAEAQRLALACVQWLGTETLRVDRVSATPNFALNGEKLALKACRVESDFGTLEANGSLDTGALKGTTDWATVLTRLENQDLDVKGRLDVPRVAERLPGLLRLRPGTRIDSGQLVLAVNSRDQSGHRRCEATLTASDVAATTAGRRIEYRQPVRLELAADVAAGKEPTATLRCTSDYLTAEVEGTASDATLSINADLDRLATDLGQVVDLGGLKLGGRIGGGFQFQRERHKSGGTTTADPPVMLADGHVLLENFKLQAPGLKPWNEPRLMLAVKMRGAADSTKISRVDEATLTVDSGGDHLTAKLRKSVESPAAATPWPVDLTIEGDVTTWLARLQPWLPSTLWQATGTMHASSTATLSMSRFQVDKANVQLQGLTATNGTLTIDEPRVEFEGKFDVEPAASRISVPTLTLATSSVSLRADQVVWQASADKQQAGGQVAFRGDLARISRWFAPAGGNPPVRLTGTVQGQADLANNGNALTISATAEAENFVAAVPATGPERTAGPVAIPTAGTQPWQPVWSEPKISLSGAATYSATADRLDLGRFEITSDVLRLANLRGQITELAGRRKIDLTGEVHYDLARITPLLWPYVGQGVKLVGQGSRDFALNGPLAPSATSTAVVPVELTGHAAVAFDRAEAYGLTTSAGEIKADLKQQVVQIAPLDLTVAQGRINVAPQIELAPTLLLTHRPQRVLERMELTPSLCQSWMKYVAPMLADATQAEGKFSLELTRCRVPLMDTTHSDVQGTLSLHSAQVRPGPMADQLITMARQISTLANSQSLPGVLGAAGSSGGDRLKLDVQSQDIQFQVRDGRVTHSQLKIVVGDVEIRTHGSVGFDQTLSIIAEVPVREAWVKNQPALKSLAGQTIQFPVSGTLARPSIDRRGLDSIVRQMGTATVNGAVQGAVQKGLEGLLKPKKK